MALRHWLQLALTEGIGPILIGRLVEATGNVEAACAASGALLRSVEGIGSVKSNEISEALRRAEKEVDAELARCEAAGVNLICREDGEYPELLKSISDPPVVLYVRGTLEARDLNAVGVVGSRRCSNYGREQAVRFGAVLAGAGVGVVGGGGRGIESAAHRGAIAATEGRTIAVLGCGVDVAYPPENKALFEEISQRGAVISEFAMESPPLKENFPRRNRIISGMSRGILVVEADIRSGALITARLAGEDHGRPVFALPGRVDNAMSAGPHELIRDGATLVRGLEDILDGLGPLPHGAVVGETAETPVVGEPKRVEAVIAGTEEQDRIMCCVNEEPVSVDDIIARSELDAEIVLRELTMMSLRGMVRRVEGQKYVKR